MRDGVCLLHVGIKFEKQSGAFLLALSPLVRRCHKQVPAPGKQFADGVTVGQPFRLVFLVLAVRLAPPVVLLSFFPALCVLFVAQAVLLTGLHFRTLSLTAMPHTQLLHGIATVLLHMEAVDGYHRIREALLDDGMHALGEVHRHLEDFRTLPPKDALESRNHVLNLGALDDGHDCALAAVSVLVGDDGVEFPVGKGGLVYAQVRTDVTPEDQPLVGMG